MARDNPRCLPPTRTLRRIRWPLQPRSRDRPTAFGDVTTAERRSHVVLGLSRSFTAFQACVKADSPAFLSLDPSTGALTPMTAPNYAPVHSYRHSFSSAAYELIRDQNAACRLLQRNHDVRTLSSGLPFPRRDGGHDHLPFLTRHARPLRVSPKSGDARRAAHSSVDLDPGAGSSHLRGFARPRYQSRRATSLGLRRRE